MACSYPIRYCCPDFEGSNLLCGRVEEGEASFDIVEELKVGQEIRVWCHGSNRVALLTMPFVVVFSLNTSRVIYNVLICLYAFPDLRKHLKEGIWL